jgi:integrase
MSRQVARFLDAWEGWVASRRAGGMAPRTLEYDVMVGAHLGRLWKNRTLSEIRPLDIDRARAALVAAGRSPSWCNTCRDKLRLFWRWARALELVRVDPTGAWGRIKSAPRRRHIALTIAEATRFIAALPARLQGWAQFAILTGLRSGTCRALRWGWFVDLPDGSARLTVPAWAMKMQREFAIMISPAARFAMGPHGEPEALVFTLPGRCWLSQMFKIAAEKAGVDRAVSPHQLRRTFVLWARAAGASPREVADLGGWKSVAVVQRFYDCETREERQAAILSALSFTQKPVAQDLPGAPKAPEVSDIKDPPPDRF